MRFIIYIILYITLFFLIATRFIQVLFFPIAIMLIGLIWPPGYEVGEMRRSISGNELLYMFLFLAIFVLVILIAGHFISDEYLSMFASGPNWKWFIFGIGALGLIGIFWRRRCLLIKPSSQSVNSTT